LLSILLLGCPTQKKQQEGTSRTPTSEEGATQISASEPEGPVRIAFVPSVESGAIETQLQEFTAELSKLLNHPVEADVVLSYTAAVEQMAAGHFEAAFLPPLAYILGHERYNIRVVLKAVRNGSPTYRGEIITRIDSGIDSLEQLKGRTLGFVDATSASGFLYPKTLLITSGIDPEKDLGGYVFLNSHSNVVIAVLRGTVDAGAVFDDARLQLVETDPKVMTETKVIAYTPPIPGDTVSFREDCIGPFYDRLAQSLITISNAGKESVLYKIYEIEALVPAEDSDYEPIRQMVAALELDIEKELEKKN